MQDVIVVGGGPAGIATALFLAHAAPHRRDRIVVLEKEHYPREKICAGAVGARAEHLLSSLGVVLDVPSEPIHGLAYRVGKTTRIVRVPRCGRVVRRVEFDHALALAARARGIRIIEGDPVVSTCIDRAGGVEVRTRGALHRGRILVGADGVGSVVRRSLGLGSGRWRAQALEVDTEPVAGDLERDLLFFDLSDRRLPGYYWDFPTRVGGRALVSRGVYALRTGSSAPEIQDVLDRELRARGLDLRHYRKKRFAERGFELHAPYARPRVVLVGEAAGIDPVTGEGIAQAIEYGAFAGRYLAERLERGEVEFEDWGPCLARSAVGRDLLTRLRGVPLFHGPPRGDVERYLETTPDFVRVGLQHFGGLPWSPTSVVRAVLRAAAFGVRHFASQALAR